ncbi:MAG TPA: SpaA isopeptide-forming pilin-related protein [candidate division Zixibacteria bacterium]|nr:SpaA isopeptide-forming pilin-related protein [candidate division Zixibacteria bacterium]
MKTRTITTEGTASRFMIAVAALSALALSLTLLVQPALAVDFATVTDHEPHSADANAASFWEARFPGAECTKSGDPGSSTFELADLPAGQAYVAVIVKTGAGAFANTVFAEPPSAGETVWADTNGNSTFDDDDKDSISHLIICVGEAESTPTPNQTPNQTPTQTPNQTPTQTPDEDDASLNIRKVDENNNRLEGAVFEVQGIAGQFVTDANGHFCIAGLPEDSTWLVTEIQAPPGYEIADPASQLVEVDDDGDCDSPDAVFVNTQAESTPTPTPEQSVEGGTPTPEQSVEGGTPTPSPAGEHETPTPEQSVQAGTGTPAASIPDGAMANLGGPSPIPTVLFGSMLLASLSALAWANVRSAHRRG